MGRPHDEEDNSPRRRLADAVDRLTNRHLESASLAGETKRHYSHHDALLGQLRGAIGGNVGGSGAGGKAANERTPVDPDALEKYLTLVAEIQSFYERWVGSHVPDIRERPERTLSQAYIAFRREVDRGTVPEAFEKAVAKQWEARCFLIEEKLSPGTTIELDRDACPECGMTWFEKVLNRGVERALQGGRVSQYAQAGGTPAQWFDKERSVALTVTYRPDGRGGLGRSFARCGCCDTTWAGESGIRALAYELEHPGLAEVAPS